MNVCELRPQCFEVRKLRALRGKAGRDAIDCPGVAAFLQGGVVQLAADIKRPFAVRLEGAVELQLVLVCSHLLACLLVLNVRRGLSGELTVDSG